MVVIGSWFVSVIKHILIIVSANCKTIFCSLSRSRIAANSANHLNRNNLQHSFANRLRSFDHEHRSHHLVIVVRHQLLQFFLRADQLGCLVRCGRGFGLGRTESFDVRNAIRQSVLWCSVRNDATQKAGRATPGEDPLKYGSTIFIFEYYITMDDVFIYLPLERHHYLQVSR